MIWKIVIDHEKNEIEKIIRLLGNLKSHTPETFKTAQSQELPEPLIIGRFHSSLQVTQISQIWKFHQYGKGTRFRLGEIELSTTQPEHDF